MLKIPFWRGWQSVICLGVVTSTILIITALALSDLPKGHAIPSWLFWVVWGLSTWAVLSTLHRFVVAQRVVDINVATKMAEIRGLSTRTKWTDLGSFSAVSSREYRGRSGILWISVHLRCPDGLIEIARFSSLWNADAARDGAKDLRLLLSQTFSMRDEGMLNY